jgi:tape measure domain-containing protein
MDEDVSPAAHKAETALARLHRQIQRFSAMGRGGAMKALGAVRDKVSGMGARAAAQSVVSRVGGGIGNVWDKGAEGLTKFGAKWDKFRNNAAVGEVFTKVKEGVMLVGAAALGIGAAIVYSTVKMVDFGQKSRAAFTMMLGGAEKGAAAFAESRVLAKQLGMDIADVTGSYQRFLSMGFDQAESKQLIAMGADMTALGNSTEKVRSVLDAMGKIQATGTMQGDELMMLAEAGINIGSIYDILGKKLGKTRAEIVKMKEAGKITSRQAIDAIKEQVLATTGQKQFGDARKVVIATTLGGGWDQLKATFRDKMIGIADAAAPGLAKALSALNTRLTKIFDGKDGDAMSSSLIRFVDWIAGAFESSLPYIEDFFRSFIDGASEVLGPMMEIGNSISAGLGVDKAETVKLLGRSIGQLVGVAISAGAALSGGFLQALVSIANVLNDIIRAIKWATDGLGAFIFSFTDAAANQKAIAEAAARDGGIGNVQGGLNGLRTGAAALQAGSSNKAISQTMNTTVNATVPPGATRADGEEFGKGVAAGNQRGMSRFFNDLNTANGT